MQRLRNNDEVRRTAMTSFSDRSRDIAAPEPRSLLAFVRPLTGVMLVLLCGAIFVLDLNLPPDDVTTGFAYALPIVATLLQPRPRPLLIAAVSAALSMAGLAILPPTKPLTIGVNLIALVTQGLVATLVHLQLRRLDDAREYAELQRRFVGILSHEVGTALTTVSGQAYRLTKLADHLSAEDLRVRAEKIRRASDRIHGLVDRIQFASRLGDGSFPVGRSPVDIAALLAQVVEQVREDRTGTRIDFTPAAPMLVAGDETLLRVVFENVVANAVKYSAPRAPVTIAVRDAGSDVRVTVVDLGSGIPQDELAKVRSPYFRGENSRGTRGAGLGLFIVARLVEAHRGRLTIHSQPTRGTSVTIDLPRDFERTSA